jgi:alpha,alpha-trehalose phosphorylase
MIRHERLRPPFQDYPADEWHVIERGFHPQFLAQLETMLALGNGYLGLRGCPEEGRPHIENGTYINGFCETRPIVYAEDAYGFAKTGQTMLNVADAKTIKLFVDDEPFRLDSAKLLSFERRLNMRSGTLDREVVWQTRSGKQVRIVSRRLVSLLEKHVAAISYEVTPLTGPAAVVIASEVAVNAPSDGADQIDPRRAKFVDGRLHYQFGYARDSRIVLCHATARSGMSVACGIDHALDSACAHTAQIAKRRFRPGRVRDQGPDGSAGAADQVHRLPHGPDLPGGGALQPGLVDD